MTTYSEKDRRLQYKKRVLISRLASAEFPRLYILVRLWASLTLNLNPSIALRLICGCLIPIDTDEMYENLSPLPQSVCEWKRSLT